MRFRPCFVASTRPVQQQQISGQRPSIARPDNWPLPQLCQALGRWSGGFFRHCRVLRNSMEAREFSDHGLKRCGSILKRLFRNPSGKRKHRPRTARVRGAVGSHAGLPEGMRPGEAAHLVKNEAVAAGIGRRRNREGAVGLSAFRLSRLRESDCPADGRPLVQCSASKTAGRFDRSVRKVRERENLLRRIGACVSSDIPNCRRTGRTDAIGRNRLDVSGRLPADKGAAR